MEGNTDNLVVLVDENGEEQEFEHIDTFEYNNRTYVVLIPYEPLDEGKDDDDEEEVVILRVEEENGEETLVSIDDMEELEDVYEEFRYRNDELMDFDDFDDEDEYDEN